MASLKEIYLAGGCFWGTEHYFKQVRGVVETEVGFANGHLENPSYRQVKSGGTGFAETVHVKYDPSVVSLDLLLDLYFRSVDPLSLNKQGEDEGTQYRTGVYYTDPADLQVIDKAFSAVEESVGRPLAVEKLPLQNFFTAEEYHQDYLDKNPAGYCHLPAALFEYARNSNK
jgi:peptide methionine sulfoxide reductase msrA/msrB